MTFEMLNICLDRFFKYNLTILLSVSDFWSYIHIYPCIPPLKLFVANILSEKC